MGIVRTDMNIHPPNLSGLSGPKGIGRTARTCLAPPAFSMAWWTFSHTRSATLNLCDPRLYQFFHSLLWLVCAASKLFWEQLEPEGDSWNLGNGFATRWHELPRIRDHTEQQVVFKHGSFQHSCLIANLGLNAKPGKNSTPGVFQNSAGSKKLNQNILTAGLLLFQMFTHWNHHCMVFLSR